MHKLGTPMRSTSVVPCYFLVCLILASVTPAMATHEVPLTCLPSPLPTVPGTPSFPVEADEGDELVLLEFWREPCVQGQLSVLLMRATPTSGSPGFCTFDFKVLQDGIQYDVTLLTSLRGDSFCDELFVPITLIFGQSSFLDHFDMDAAFTIVLSGFRGQPRLEIPPAEEVPDRPPQVTGTLTGVVPSKIVCQNVTRRQKVTITGQSLSWDCTAHGLEVRSGDKVKVTIQGQVP